MIYSGHKAAVFSEPVKAQSAWPQPKLLEEGYKGFNLVRYSQVYGIPQAAGDLDIARVRLDDYPGLCSGATPDAVKAQIDALLPVLVEEGYKGFNLVRYVTIKSTASDLPPSPSTVPTVAPNIAS